MTDENKIALLQQKQAEALRGGGEARIEKQHQSGKLTARERLDLLLDEGSFEEIGLLVTHRASGFGLDAKKIPGDGVVTGYGRIQGRWVYVFAQDFTVLGGSLAEAHAQKIVRIMDLAMDNGAPLIGLCDSGGARIQEGVVSLAGYADIFYRNTKASGVIPQLSAVMGPSAGGAVYSPALTDFIAMVENTSYMFVTGPEVVKTVTNETVSFEDLGGAETHACKSGITHFTYPDEFQLIEGLKTLLSYLPQNCEERPPSRPYEAGDETRPQLTDLLPESANQAYNMKRMIKALVDADSFFEVQKDYAPNIVIGFARLAGRSIGIVANQPAYMAGVLDIYSAKKGARFVRFCDCFNVPLLVLEDVPGFLPGTQQEWNGIIAEGAKLLYAFSEATVPRITVITRKAYGGAYDVMNSKHIGADMNYAWPNAEIAVMGAKGAVEIIFKKEIAAAENPQEKWREREQHYQTTFANPYHAAARGYIDEVITADKTREKLIRSFEMLENKALRLPRKKHGNMPL